MRMIFRDYSRRTRNKRVTRKSIKTSEVTLGNKSDDGRRRNSARRRISNCAVGTNGTTAYRAKPRLATGNN